MWPNRFGKLVKADKITKLAQDENHLNAFKKFCDQDDRCVFVFEGDGELQVNSRPPAPDKMGKKILAFTKNEIDAGVELAELGNKVAVTELSPDAVRQIMALSREVYFPLLTNPGNQEGWPEVIAKELTENLHRFLAQTFVTLGQMSGETLLPLPPEEVYTNMEKNQQDKDSVHVLETAVIAWTKQIRDILKLVCLMLPYLFMSCTFAMPCRDVQMRCVAGATPVPLSMHSAFYGRCPCGPFCWATCPYARDNRSRRTCCAANPIQGRKLRWTSGTKKATIST